MLESGQMELLAMRDILPNRFQPRIHFDEGKLNELAESIRKYGLIQPIVVRQIGSKYEIIAGERRFKASSLANKETIPAIIVNLSDRDSEEIALLENIQRQDLTPIEEAVSYKRILDVGYITQDELAQKIGKSQSFIANKIRLLNLDDEVQDALLHGKISERHARSLLKLHNEKKQTEMLNRIINERLTVKMTDREIKKILESDNEKEKNIPLARGDVETLIIEKKPKRAVPKGSHRIIKVNPPEDLMEQIKERERKTSFMDIDKILEEAKDITPREDAKPANDIAELMKQDASLNPSPNIQSGPEPEAIPAAPTINNEQNKFVNLGAINQTNSTSSPSLQAIPSQPLSPVSFDSIFNQAPAQPSQPLMQSNDNHVNTILPQQPVNLMSPQENAINPLMTPASSSAPAMESERVGLPNNQIAENKFISAPPVNEISQQPPLGPSSLNSDIPNGMQPQQPINLMSPQENAINPLMTPSSPMNIPDSDILEGPNNINSEVSQTPIQPNLNNSSNFNQVINLVRNVVSQIERLGYFIDVDEADLGNNYQITFKINKD